MNDYDSWQIGSKSALLNPQYIFVFPDESSQNFLALSYVLEYCIMDYSRQHTESKLYDFRRI